MAKLENILLIVNLLHHRQSVSLETIRSVCGVSERTAYRYVRTISEANIPVYFDKNTNGYSLLNKTTLNIDDLRIDECILVFLALRLLARNVNQPYRTAVEALIQKVLSRQSFVIEELWASFGVRLDDSLALRDLSDLITSQIIHAAVVNARTLRLTLRDDVQARSVVEIEHPKLRFSKGWEVVEDQRAQKTPIGLDAVMQAAIM
jgi:predicted DNA-binding transcriptional regulator YafY